MTKLKSPLLSLEARGPLAGTLSFDNRASSPRVRTKPIPPNPRSLAQMYQRWEYQDYIYLWHALPLATRQAWRSAAVPYHMTGFAFYMRTRLRARDDILGLWHMDSVSGAITLDSSPNSNNATVFGAAITPGIISNALHFDGIDDYLNVGNDPSLNLTSQNFTVSAIVKLDEIDRGQGIFSRGLWKTDGLYISLVPANRLRLDTWQSGFQQSTVSETFAQVDTVYRLAIVRQGATAYIFIDGVDHTLIHGTHIDPASSTRNAYIGAYLSTQERLKGTLDHLEIREGILPTALLFKRNERRYPL